MNSQKFTPENILFGHLLDERKLKCSKQGFVDAIVFYAENLMILPDQLMAVIELETARTFDPAITNSLGYTGLIQFGKVAAREVGTTRAKLRQMNGVEQLEYVYLYLDKYLGKMESLADIYLAIFFPVAIGKNDGFVLQARGLPAKKVALWNPLYDMNKDNRIQVYEVKAKLKARLPKSHHWIV